MAVLAKNLWSLFKLRISLAIMLCALAGIAVAPGPALAGWQMALLGFAVLLSAASAGAFNHYVECDLDARMPRTRDRPFVTGYFRRGPLWLAILVGVLGVIWQARKASLEAQRAQQIAALVTSLFTDADPYSGSDREMTVPDLLDRGRERLQGELDEDPELAARLTSVLGRAYEGQGQYESAIELQLEQARGTEIASEETDHEGIGGLPRQVQEAHHHG